MKKIIVGIFAFAVLLSGQNVFASSTWNGASNDCPTVAIANYTTNTGYNDPCWPLSTVSAKPGESINVRIYYHNTSSVTATNTRIILNAPTGKNTTHSFSGQIVSDQGSLSFGPVRVNLSESQSLTFGSTRWYPNQTQSQASFLNGQNGSELISGGLNIGSIAPGWNTQGSVVVSFKVTQTAPDNICKDTSATNYGGSLPCTYPVTQYCKISYFTVDGSSSTSVEKGDYVKLEWGTENCTSVNISNNIGSVSASSSKNIYPASSGSYTLTAYSPTTGNITKTVYVNVTSQPDNICKDTSATNYGGSLPCTYPAPSSCKINSFTVDGSNSANIEKGDTANLSWNTSNCNSVSISTIGSVSKVDSLSVRPNYSISYTLTANSLTSGSVSRTVYVNVTTQPQYVCTNTSASNYGQLGSCVFPTPKYCEINNFSASDTSIEKGDASTLTWTTSNCNYVVLSGYGQMNANSNKSVRPSYDTVYTLTAYGNNGSNDGDTIKIYVNESDNDDECRITDFSADDTTVDDGDYVELEWETENCNYVSIDGVGSHMNENDNEKVRMTTTKTFTLKAYGDNGSDSDTLKIYVNEEDNDENECRVVDFSASNTSIKKGDPVVIDWDTEDCDYVNISGIGSYLNPTDDYRFYPSYTGTYTIKAYGSNGTDSDSIKIYVNETIDPNPIYEVNSTVVTTVATNVTQNSALLNGLVTNSNSSTANVYFEYGTSVNLGGRTGTKTVNGNSSFSDYVYGLQANTIYYFRAVSENNGGLSRGSIQIFRTIGYASTNTVVRTVVEGTTVVGTASPVMLEINNRYQYLGIGDLVDYTVYYKNIGSSTLRNPMLQVVLPSGITLINSSAGTFSGETNTLSVPIMDLKKGEEGVLYLQGRVDSIPDGLAQIVTTAILIYTSSNGAQENAMAYALNNPKVMIAGTSNNLGAAAFLSGNFGGIGFIGWLLIVLIILLIALVARSFFRDRTVVYTSSNHGGH